MDLAFDDGGVGACLDLKAGNAVVVDVVALKIAHAVVEGKDADVAAVVNVVTTHDRVCVILHPHSRQRVATDFVVFVGTLDARARGGKRGDMRKNSREKAHPPLGSSRLMCARKSEKNT